MDEDSGSKKDVLSSIVDRGNTILNGSGGKDSDSDLENTETNGTGRFNRRQYLKAGAAAVGVSPLVGAAVGSTGEHDVSFDRVVNAVEDLSMDPTGNEPIDAALASAYQTGTLIEFPPGEYAVSNEAPIGPRGSASRFGMVGLGDSHTDVQFTFPNADGSGGFWFIHQRGGSDLVFANFAIDVTDDDTTMVNCRFDANDGVLLEDIEWLGFIPHRSYSYGQVLSCDALAESGVNTLRRVILGRGGAHLRPHGSVSPPPGTSGIRVYPRHQGELVCEDLHIEQLGADAIRDSNGEGILTVRGGFFKNNHTSNIRLQDGHHPTKTASVTGATIVLDQANPERPTHGSEYYHASGLMIDSTVGGSGVVIEDCDIHCESITASSHWGLIRATNTGNSNTGGFTIRNSRIHNETNLQTLWVQPASSDSDQPWGVTIENTDIEVTGNSQDYGSVILLEDHRNESRIADSCIYAPSDQIDGIVVYNSDDVIVEDSNIYVGGDAVDYNNSSGDIRNITHEESCESSSDDENEDDDESENGDSGPDERHFEISAVDDVAEYTITVDGEAEYGDNADTFEHEYQDTITEDGEYTVVHGYVGGGGVDDYHITGAVVDGQTTAPLELWVDGEAVDLDELVESDRETIEDEETSDDEETEEGEEGDEEDEEESEAEPAVERHFEISAVDDVAEYTITVEGEAEYGDNADTFEHEYQDTITEDGEYTVVHGYVGGGGVDDYHITGAVIDGDTTAPLELWVDGEAVDLDELVESDRETTEDEETSDDEETEVVETDHELAIVGTGTPSTYEFTVEETLQLLEDGDNVELSETTATGTVESEQHRFGFSGEIAAFDIEGEAAVYVDGQQVNPDALATAEDPFLTDRIEFDGDGNETNYEFTVSGSVHKAPDLGDVEAEDRIEGETVTGSVTEGVDGYRFVGDLTSLRIQGTADVYFANEDETDA